MNLLAATDDFGLSFVLEVVAFFIFLFIGWKYVWSDGLALKTRMQSQIEAIRGQLAAGEVAKVEAAKLLEVKRQSLEAAKAEAASIVSTAQSSAEELVAEGRQRAEEEYQRLVDRAGTELQAELNRIRDDVHREMAARVLVATEAVIEAELDSGAHHRLIAEAIVATEAEEA